MSSKRLIKFFVLVIIILSILMFQSLNATIYSTVSGKVIDEETGEGIKGVEVLLHKVRGHYFSFRTFTDSEGNFKIIKVNANEYNIHFWPPSPYAWKRTVKDAKYDRILVQEGREVTILKKLKVGGVLKIKTFDSNGNKPIEGVWFVFYGVNSRLHWDKGTLSNSQGEFELDRLEEGTYELNAWYEGFGMKEIEFYINYKQITFIEIPFNSNSHTGVNGYIKCKLDGTPLKSIVVGINRTDKYGTSKCYSDDNGYYSAVDLEPGDYTINIIGLNAGIDEYGEVEDLFIKKPVKIIEGQKAVVNFNVDCSIEYENKENELGK